jgi:hypothetical protein
VLLWHADDEGAPGRFLIVLARSVRHPCGMPLYLDRHEFTNLGAFEVEWTQVGAV